MSFNKYTHNTFVFFTALPVMTLISVLSITSAFAENNEHYQQEPILPLPQKTEVNTDKANLGEKLFFETRLSKNSNISCASCHQLGSGGDDNVAKGISTSADQHIINTPSIFNAQYNFRQKWDGSAKTLYEQTDLAIENSHELNNTWSMVVSRLAADKEMTQDFNDIYKDGMTKHNIINSLVEFEKTLVTANSRFDNYLRNNQESLTKEEIEGYLVFKEVGCISCHQGINIGGNLFQKFGYFYNYIAERGNISKPDYGKMNTTNRQEDKFVFKVPSLRNIAVTAPYLHDGSADTLEETITIMGKTQLGRTLTESEVSLIKKFLNTLTGEYKNKQLDEQL